MVIFRWRDGLVAKHGLRPRSACCTLPRTRRCGQSVWATPALGMDGRRRYVLWVLRQRQPRPSVYPHKPAPVTPRCNLTPVDSAAFAASSSTGSIIEYSTPAHALHVLPALDEGCRSQCYELTTCRTAGRLPIRASYSAASCFGNDAIFVKEYGQR